MHHETYGFMAFNPGDEITFVRWDTLETYAPNTVTEVEMLNPRDLLLTLASPGPADWKKDDVIENVTWTPEVEIRGCTVSRVPTRGFLITARRKVLVSENIFLHPVRNGIHVECDAEGWFESGCVRDMTIRRNRFIGCGKQAILISPRSAEPIDSVHENIRIEYYEFILREDEATAVEASSTRGLVIANNRIYSELPRTEGQVIETHHCPDVDIIDNQCLQVAHRANMPGK